MSPIFNVLFMLEYCNTYSVSLAYKKNQAYVVLTIIILLVIFLHDGVQLGCNCALQMMNYCIFHSEQDRHYNQENDDKNHI